MKARARTVMVHAVDAGVAYAAVVAAATLQRERYYCGQQLEQYRGGFGIKQVRQILASETGSPRFVFIPPPPLHPNELLSGTTAVGGVGDSARATLRRRLGGGGEWRAASTLEVVMEAAKYMRGR